MFGICWSLIHMYIDSFMIVCVDTPDTKHAPRTLNGEYDTTKDKNTKDLSSRTTTRLPGHGVQWFGLVSAKSPQSGGYGS